jgi:pilus assembly protein CpaB
MKNRTVIGLICIAAAAAAAFGLAPALAGNAAAETVAVRAVNRIPAGTLIEEDDVETVALGAQNLPAGLVTSTAAAVGRYATVDIVPGDLVLEEKLGDESASMTFALRTLRGGELAVTVRVTSFADGFSGQLRNGDVIQLYIFDRSTGQAFLPPELSYVSVITTVTGQGRCLDDAGEADESSSLPETIMLRVNRTQASLLFGYASSASVCCAFVCHGDTAAASEYLSAQAAFFDRGGEAPTDGGQDLPAPTDEGRDRPELSGAEVLPWPR